MSIIDWAANKIAKLSINRAARQQVEEITARVYEQARREVTREIVEALQADMVETAHLGHLDAVDIIQANWAV